MLQRGGQVLLMLTTPTPVLYVESLADAAKGKVKAAERAAEKKKNEKEDKKKEKKMKKRNEVLQQRLQQRTGLAGPVMPRPSALCALAGARVRAVAEGRPAWVLATVRLRAAAARLRAVAEGHQGHGAGGMPRPRILADCDDGCNLFQWALKWRPGRVLALQGPG